MGYFPDIDGVDVFQQHPLQFRPYPPDPRVTPAMAAGVTDKLWELGDMVRTIEEWEAAQQLEEGKMRIDVTFISFGLVFLICGMAFGMWIGAAQDLQFADAHAHLNLLGFVVPTIYGLIHRAYPSLALSRLAWPQCIAHFIGVLIFVPGIVVVTMTGNQLFVIVGSIMVILATLTFGFVFFTANKSD